MMYDEVLRMRRARYMQLLRGVPRDMQSLSH
jgi:hypothetical protein